MKYRKLLAVLIIAALVFAAGVEVCADEVVQNEDGTYSVVAGTGEESGDTGSEEAESTSETETETETESETESEETEQTYTPDVSAPTIVKHPGSEYDHTAGDSVLFTAACSENVEANWFFNDGVPIAQIGSVYPGVSATVSTTIYNSAYPGTKLTIKNLTRASSGITIYVEFSTSYGILKSNEATITVTKGTDVAVASTPTPTVTPAATPTATPTAAPTPAATPTATPTQTVDTDTANAPAGTASGAAAASADPAVQSASTDSQNGTNVDLSGYSFSETASDSNGYQFTSEKQAEWTAPGAGLAVAACAIVAIIAFLLMALYSMGVLRFRALERLIGGKDYVSPDDEDEYDDDEDDDFDD